MTPPADSSDCLVEIDARDSTEFAADVRKGLSGRHKRIPSKYFYDTRGSALFEEICEQPEYYLTRTELAILRDHAGSMAKAVGPHALVVEYGSGSAIKTRLLLDALIDPVAYVPVEISHSALDDSVQRLARMFPRIEILPVSADFTTRVSLPQPKKRRPASVLVFFPGSTLGNFETPDAVRLLEVMYEEIGPRGAALVGIDLRKDVERIEAAYNDRAGVTAAFTLNLLARLNRELDADFDLRQFRHHARYNVLAGRIETHIVSRIDQRVRVDGMAVDFAAGEPMLVEYSCKYALPEFERMAARARLQVSATWTDPEGLFAMQLLRRK
ncbi:MAG: L-histidine N(alpha)-methyltransferase [Panacagrimonas sp.]